MTDLWLGCLMLDQTLGGWRGLWSDELITWRECDLDYRTDSSLVEHLGVSI